MNENPYIQGTKFSTTRKPGQITIPGKFSGYQAEAHSDLIAAIKKLEQQNQQLMQLASLTAHQLKTPLISLIWQTDKMKQTWCSEPEQPYPSGLDYIEFCAQEIKKQFEDILGYSLSRNTSEKISLDSIIKSIIKLIRTDKQIIYTITEPDEKITFDRVIMKIIFQNLIINAVEHTPEKILKVDLEVLRNERRIQISYKDNSPGIPEHDWQDSSSKISFQGKGLGLMLIRQVATQAGMRIVMHPNAKNCLIIEIPLIENQVLRH